MRVAGGRTLRRAVVLLTAALALLLVYGVAVEPRLLLDQRRLTVQIPGLDPSWEGERLAVFSDLQIGMWLANTGMVERVVEETVEAEPAAVLLVGDFVYSRSPDVAQQVQQVLRLLRPLLEAQIPTFAVMGNHDYAVDAVDELTSAFRAAGVQVLRNDRAAVPAPPGSGGEPLHVVGLGPVLPNSALPSLVDAEQALRGLPEDAPRVVMLHNPTGFPQLPPGSAPFAVAGHTHCGQMALPWAPRWSYLALLQDDQVVADGWAPQEYGAAGNRLFVTCGLGFSVVPMRINAPPQLVLVELTSPD